LASYSINSSRFFGEIYSIYLEDIVFSSYSLRNCYDDDDEIKDIAISVKNNGLLQPIVVRAKENVFEIVAGCRRYLACKSLGWKEIPCQVVQLNDMQAFEVSLIENIQRKSLSPLEEANAFRKYICDKGWGGISELSSKIGKSPSFITKRIALLHLPIDVKEKINNSSLSPSTAEELLSIKDSEKQSELARLIAKRHLSTKRVRELVKEDPFYCENSEKVEVRSDLQSFNKSIVALRIAMTRMVDIIEEEDNFLIHELLIHHTKVLHGQIDNLIKAKRKYAKNIYRYRKILSQ
jgi:ParB family chromosome partitioning protein